MTASLTAGHVHRASAGGGFLSGVCGKLSLGSSLGKLTPKQLGDEDEIDEDVRREANRVTAGGADNDVVKVGKELEFVLGLYAQPPDGIVRAVWSGRADATVTTAVVSKNMPMRQSYYPPVASGRLTVRVHNGSTMRFRSSRKPRERIWLIAAKNPGIAPIVVASFVALFVYLYFTWYVFPVYVVFFPFLCPFCPPFYRR